MALRQKSIGERSSALSADTLFAQRPVKAGWQPATEYALIDDPSESSRCEWPRLEEQLVTSASKQPAPGPRDTRGPVR